MKEFPIIQLASGSPRRKMLIEALDLEYKVHYLDCDESYPASLMGSDVAMHIVQKKLDAALKQIKQEGMILCADTIVLYKDEILEKPTDSASAQIMLRKLSGAMHDVVTAVALSDRVKKKVFYDKSKVKFAEMNPEEIRYYIEEYRPYDKAGSYAIQEWIGHAFIESIEGSYNTIIGLPTQQVYQQLKEW